MDKINFKDQVFYHPLVKCGDWFYSLDDRFLLGGERSPKTRIESINRFLEQQDRQPTTLLDIGCNIGLFSHYYSRVRGMICTGVENNKHNDLKGWAHDNNVEVAQMLSKLYRIEHEPSFIVDDYRTLTQDYDMILYLSVWHHHMHNTYEPAVSKSQAMGYLYDVIDRANMYVAFEHDDKSGVTIDQLVQQLKDYYGEEISISTPEPISDRSRRNNYDFQRYMVYITKHPATSLNSTRYFNQNVTVCITSMLRPHALKQCVQSVRSHYPRVKILIGDSGCSVNTDQYDNKCEVLQLPYHCGVSYTRNQLVQHVQTPYFILLEDDMKVTGDLPQLLLNLERHNYDILGMVLKEAGNIRYWAKNFHLDNGVLRTENVELTDSCQSCDIILNAFIARTSKVLLHPWDTYLKTYEHTLYFYDNWQSQHPLSIGLCREVVVQHDHDNSSSIYNQLRRPPLDHLQHAIYQRGLKAITSGSQLYYAAHIPDKPAPDYDSSYPFTIYKSEEAQVEARTDGNYIWLPRVQRDFTKEGHVYGMDVQRQAYVQSGEILDRLLALKKAGTYPQGLAVLTGYDDNYIILECVQGALLCNRNHFTPLYDQVNPCHLDYDVKVSAMALFKPLRKLHKQGLCHTDVVEFNYMVDHQGNIYLIDLLSIVPLTPEYLELDHKCYAEMLSRLRQEYPGKING